MDQLAKKRERESERASETQRRFENILSVYFNYKFDANFVWQ